MWEVKESDQCADLHGTRCGPRNVPMYIFKESIGLEVYTFVCKVTSPVM
jgi:hypothetical protein